VQELQEVNSVDYMDEGLRDKTLKAIAPPHTAPLPTQ
jgi:hypothetical protein